jgi:hypothetical protein
MGAYVEKLKLFQMCEMIVSEANGKAVCLHYM